ncbi:hypothetical protein PRIPAC_80032 [Pristionchus pacificus]|uniref:CHK kinase-like domain-containing protein n=1 Tax=Pristionchus pacificus TaxID=54126 RepID=A0A8R1YXM3_PRIPA|nr:hypothetical protein PRIPAC_80032 [Pristionchus pacificus]
MEPVVLVPKRELILRLLHEEGKKPSDDVDFSFSRIGEGNGVASLLYKKEIKLPKFYGGQHCVGDEEGILILEDFSDRMKVEVDFMSGFSIELFPASDKKVFYDALTQLRFRKLHNFAENIEQLTEHYPEFASNAPVALIHCDLWPMNMLYKEEEGKTRLLAFIDWQCVTLGNALFDIAELCTISLSPEMRRRHEKELSVKLYRRYFKWCVLMLTLMMTFQKTADVPDQNSNDGPITSRLRVIFEDIDDDY